MSYGHLMRIEELALYQIIKPLTIKHLLVYC
ncbi:hypothetical protein FWK35_00031580, partial [Aphis craccivora]